MLQPKQVEKLVSCKGARNKKTWSVQLKNPHC
jgi:hypothetical protein